MNNKSIHFLLAASTVIPAGIFISSSPAKAHSFDYCVEILQEEAEIADTGTSRRKLKQKYPKEYQEISEECDQELKGNGLLTIKQVKDKKNQKKAARLVRRGLLDQDVLSQSKVSQRQADLGRREARLRRLREQICANPAPEEKYACPKKAKASPRSSVPGASNTLVSAALQFGKQISQLFTGVPQARNTLVAAAPQIGSDTPVTQTGVDNSGGTLVAQADSVGQWSGSFNWPHIAVHMAVGPNGKVLSWTRPKLSPKTHPSTGQPVPAYTLWDPTTSGFSSVPSIKTDIFCAGHDFAPSGNLLVVSGHASNVAGDGSKDINTYSFFTNSWYQYPNKLKTGRWYVTVTYNSLGEGVIVGGSISNEGDLNPVPEVWGKGGVVRALSGASLALPVKPYVWNFLDPSGKIFNAGPTKTTRVLDTTGTGKWSTISDNNFGNRYYGSAVMYDEGKVIIIGGSNAFYGPPTKTVEVIDLSKSNKWIPVGQMQFARRQHVGTLLADGKILVVGGTSLGSFNNTDGRILAGEIWDPVTTAWTTVASMSVTRSYHQTAVLLPDARVLVAGGGLPVGNGAKNDPSNTQGNFSAETYSPPYLFKGSRPTISAAPGSVGYGKTFTVQTPDAGSIAKVHWIKLSSMTHQTDMGQRINPLNFKPVAGGLSITTPSNKNLCPPGHYMLFVLNSQGVPSVSKIVKIG